MKKYLKLAIGSQVYKYLLYEFRETVAFIQSKTGSTQERFLNISILDDGTQEDLLSYISTNINYILDGKGKVVDEEDNILTSTDNYSAASDVSRVLNEISNDITIRMRLIHKSRT